MKELGEMLSQDVSYQEKMKYGFLTMKEIERRAKTMGFKVVDFSYIGEKDNVREYELRISKEYNGTSKDVKISLKSWRYLSKLEQLVNYYNNQVERCTKILRILDREFKEKEFESAKIRDDIVVLSFWELYKEEIMPIFRKLKRLTRYVMLDGYIIL